MTTKDANGKELHNGDTVHVAKDLKVKGSSIKLKRGTVLKNVSLTHDPELVECKKGKTTMVLRTEFLKKA